jgi:hypothetical protein
MKKISLMIMLMVSVSLSASEIYKGYVYIDGAKGCLDDTKPSSCFDLRFGKVVYFNESQIGDLLKNTWVSLNKYGPRNKTWWLKSEAVTLQKDLKPFGVDSFTVKSYKWDGGESRVEYSFSKETKLKVVNYDYTQYYSCSLYSKRNLLEIRCKDIDSDETHTETVRYKDGKLIPSKCGGWCEIKYKDGQVDVRRFE